MQYTYVRGVYLREASDRPESALKWREKPERQNLQSLLAATGCNVAVPVRTGHAAI